MIKTDRSKVLAVVLIITLLFLEGCVVLPLNRDLKKIFSSYLPEIDNNPIILIPGIIGSRLVNTTNNSVVWGALKLKNALFLTERDSIALPIDNLPLSENKDDVTSKGIITRYDFPIGIIQFTVYRELLGMFEEIGYTFGDIRNPKPEDNLYIFDYDWRRDNVETAKLLAERIEHIKKVKKNPKLKFNFVCHSMGGLIARYYLRYGGKDVLDQAPDFRVTYAGAKNIKRLILVAVPNLGSLPVFSFLHKGLDLLIVKYPPYVLYTLPSIYQLIPFKGVKSFVDTQGNDIDVDLYDIENWKKYGWSMYSEKMETLTRLRHKAKYKDDWQGRLEEFQKKRDRFVEAALRRADQFQQSLNFKLKRKCKCEIMLFGGDMEWTMNKAILKQGPDGTWRTSFWDPRLKDKIMLPGDTMVTRCSLFGIPTKSITKRGWSTSPLNISFSLFVDQKHENIHKDGTFQNNLLHILLGD